MKKDIEGRADIDLLMQDFYERAMSDAEIGYLFTDVAKLDLEKHLPVIGDFWETLLFRTGDYSRYGRTPLQVHAHLHSLSPLLPQHFDRWLEIFIECTDRSFEGEVAEFIKLRARMIANRMTEYLSYI